jgi:hypothetical protein
MSKAKVAEKSFKGVSDKDRAASFFKENKEDVLNHVEEIDYKVSSGSLTFDIYTKGGIGPGIIRFAGPYESGKTSCVLNFMSDFLFNDKLPFRRKGIFIKSEGRLSVDIKDRCNFKFVNHPSEWEDGTCLVVSSNKFETIFSFLKELIVNNPEEVKYFIVIDSMDCLIKKDDVKKGFDQSAQVAGGALLTSTFLKQLALEIKIYGHIFVAISQIRAEIKLNPYVSTPPKDNFSGGNALLHAADWIFELKSINKGDRFMLGSDKYEKGGKGFDGHNVTVKIHKSTNQTTDQEFSYPIKYGIKKGNSVWLEKEAADCLLGWDLVKKDRAWLSTSALLKKDLAEIYQLEVPDQFHGSGELQKFVSENKPVIEYVCEKAKFFV